MGEKNKKQKVKINKNQSNNLKKYWWFYMVLFIYLIANIIFSQNINQLYHYLVVDDKRAVIEFLQKSENQFYFPLQLNIYKKMFGSQLEEVVYYEKNTRLNEIKKLEQILTINPHSRDVLYRLYQLYLEENDKDKANSYLKQAKEIDPILE